MQNQTKQEQILDALQALLENKNIQNISVSEIAQTAGIGKGSIYYYFPSKDSIVDALVERNYEKPLETAKNLARQTDISPFTRMAMIFQACRNSTSAFHAQKGTAPSRRQGGCLHTAEIHEASDFRNEAGAGGNHPPGHRYGPDRASTIPPPWRRSH